ncbi:unnamed protein product [Citrullus colocynthis]|uniref:Secreted protein n=1 Tax=Citrullus colocynthis TaxID=252529 RepID=A0ABP0YX46_9ROSI
MGLTRTQETNEKTTAVFAALVCTASSSTPATNPLDGSLLLPLVNCSVRTATARNLHSRMIFFPDVRAARNTHEQRRSTPPRGPHADLRRQRELSWVSATRFLVH